MKIEEDIMTQLKTKKQTVTLKIAYGGLLIALGILLPQAFHIFGQEAGMIFLPIQIPVFMAGLLLGPIYGGIVGAAVPILSCILTAMPPVPKVYFMLFEMIMYGAAAGLLKKKCNVFFSILGAIAAGRLVYGTALAVGVYLLGIHAPFANTAAYLSTLVTGIPGNIIQLTLLPALYIGLRRGGFTFDEK